jgi:hypothetical protein
MGLGRRIFAAGEVLTAGNVMNYLMDQSVMNFAGTAARGSAIGTAVTEGMVSYLNDTDNFEVYRAIGTAAPAWNPMAFRSEVIPIVANSTARNTAYPSPVQGNAVFRNDLGLTETYYTAAGTANPGGRASAGWYNNQRNIGLVPMVPATVNISGGTATANTVGLISFTGVTTAGISLNNVFSTAYDAYKIFIRIPTTTAAASLQIRWRSAGADNTTNNYLQTWFMNRTSGATQTNNGFATSTGLLQWSAGLTNDYNMWTGDAMNPASTGKKNIFGKGFASDASGAYVVDSSSMFNSSVSAFDGFTIYPTAGTITGTIQVFGYNI